MNKKSLAFGAFIVFVLFLVGCATTSINEKSGALKDLKDAPPGKLVARVLPEITLVTSAGDSHLGKLTSLEGGTVTLLPYPYWNVEPITIDLDEIHMVQTQKRGGRAGSGFLHGFSWTYIIVGILSGVTSKYDEDYEFALGVSAGAGLIGGLIGLAVGGLADAVAKTDYKFYSMSLAEKTAAIKKFMGL